MIIKKKNATYGDYDVSVSHGQLIAIRDALTAAHAEPMADEILQEINFYLENVPGPGESKEEFEARETTGKDIENSANLPGEEGAPEEAEDGFAGVPSAAGEDDFEAGPPVSDEGDELPPDEGGGEEGSSPLPPPPADDEGGEPRSPVPPAPQE